MKNYIILACLLLVGCKNWKLKQSAYRYESSMDQHLVGTRNSQVLSWTDSAGYHWQYWADSAFYFHPDSGLWAYGGLLSASQARRSGVLLETKALHDERETAQSMISEEQNSYRTTWTGLLWIVGTLILCLLILFFFKTSRELR